MKRDILLAAIGLVLVTLKLVFKAFLWAISESLTPATPVSHFDTKGEIAALEHNL